LNRGQKFCFGVRVKDSTFFHRRTSMRRARAKTWAAGTPVTRPLSRSSNLVLTVSAHACSTTGAKLVGQSRAFSLSATSWRAFIGRRRISASICSTVLIIQTIPVR
jgi:hypothetical protein